MTKQREFSEAEARKVGDSIGINWNIVDINEFRMGLHIELEHGSHDPDTNVINNDEKLAGKIAWAHLKELPDYYTRLKKMESEGEAFWAEKSGQ